MDGLEFIRDLGIVVFVAAWAGWGCRRIGLSPVVGYLLAGLIVGPYTPPASLVTDTARIATLAQLGLVFLMFSIGMQLSLRRLKALGATVLVATALGAAVVFTLARGLGLVLGLDAMQGLFLAGMLVASSSAIVSKSLLESGRLHSPSGQFAGAITVLEDVVAVVVLALLNSYLQFGGAGEVRLGAALGGMGAFIVLLGVGGLLLVPWLLRRLDRTGNDELRTLIVAGLLCLLAVGAQGAGYSLALGAFLLGVVVADTPQRTALDRAFGGLRDVFSAVFFVAIGMMIDLHAFGAIWWQVLAVALFAVVVRSAAYALVLVATGQPTRLAVEGGLALTPVGEFAFIIAQVGVTAGVLPPEYQPLSVGVALLTAIVAPWLTARAAPLAERVVACQPALVERLFDEYRRWLERVQARRAGSVLWRLSRKRLLQIGVGLAFASGLLQFAPPLEQAVRQIARLDVLLPRFSQVLFWIALALVVLAVCVAVWRNISALALIVAEATTRELPNAAVLRPVVETGLKVGAGFLLFFWLTAVSPFHPRRWWVLLIVVAVAAVVLALLWRRLIHWHSHLEVRLQESLAPGAASELLAQAPPGWELRIDEVVLPENTAAAGRSLGALELRSRFGCTVVGIDRQGVGLTNPAPDTVLFPEDRVLLLGSPEQIGAARRELDAVAETVTGPALADLVLNRVRVAPESPQAGRTLADSAPGRETGVQIAGILRRGERILNPAGSERLEPRDELLVLGTPTQVREFRRWLAGAD
ncbi:MAG TPA: cation:proton antiporter [Opitutaceae bacterium]|nr:cation:proton antiporter [Opitutaceae bacterium]